jgi:hydrogenase nickel incorporation protein HypA/HybF
MHEFSIACGLVEKLLQFSGENPDKKIIEVRLEVGELSHIEEEQLRFAYGSIITETPLEGSTLLIEDVKAAVECPHCSYRGRPKYWDGALSGTPVATLECPDCGKAANPVGGQECAIKSVRLLQSEPAAF